MTDGDFPELLELRRIIDAGGSDLESRVICEIAAGDHRYPIHAISIGNPDPALPAIGFFGGIHGLERIGTEVVMAYLRSIVGRLKWDSLLHRQLESVRMVFMPIVNPGGMMLGTRANPAGIDLMRNAPVSATEPVPLLVGGQRISAALPWYRGLATAPMEPENAAVCQVVDEELLSRRFSIAIDCHSGFGLHDRIWFPYAHTSRPVSRLAELHALKAIFDGTHAHHRYVFEPQSRHYLAHGDLWDYLYLRAQSAPERIFLPLTLEMGSWIWVRKNPRQLFTRHGIFNPLVQHRQQRVLRRHMAWLDFASRAACSHERWVPVGEDRALHQAQAMASWYAGAAQ